STPMNSTDHFPLLGEPLSLDLANTRIRIGNSVTDLLDSTAALDEWLAAESLRINWVGKTSTEDWQAVIALRDAIIELFQARREGGHPSQAKIAMVNQALSAPT